MRLLIKNGTIIDPVKENMYQTDILIENEKISKIEPIVVNEENINEYDNIIDAKGLYIAPGLIDTHVHFRDPGFTHKEDIETGAEAAKAGGYTQVVMMANTNPHVDNEDTLKYMLEKGKNTGIKVQVCGNVTMGMKGKELTDMASLKEMGAVGFTDDGVPILDKDICLEAMKICERLNVPISFHEENPAFIENNGVNKGVASEYFNIGGSPREAEIDLVKRDIELALLLYEGGSNINPAIVIQHISTKEAVDMVKAARIKGLNIHAEATPHHFTLIDEDVIEHGTLAKMNPPLREKEDREAIRQGLADGTIDMIATDHAPHSKEEKAQDITKAPSGIIGLETALSLAIRELIDNGYMSYPKLMQRMSLAPAKLYGLEGGEIAAGKKADLIIFDPKERRSVKCFKSKASNSPFIGQSLPGVIKYTICDGNIVYKG